MATNANKPIDIIIVTWNSIDYLKACLDSIEKYTKNIPYHLIIVNNGSEDGTSEFLQQFQKNKDILILENKANLGYPKALLEGYLLSTSKFVCLMNDDVITSPNWLSNLVQVIKTNPKVGILGPIRPGAYFIHPYTKLLSKITLEESKKKRKTPLGQLKYFTHGKDFSLFVDEYKRINSQFDGYFDSLPYIVSTCCALIRRSAIEKVGGIVDRQFVKYGGDDVDLCWRLIKAGYKLEITSKSYVHHFEHISMNKNNVDRQKYLRTNGQRLYKKWIDEIKKYLTLKLSKGLTKEQILQESWLLQRLADDVGDQFWGQLKITK